MLTSIDFSRLALAGGTAFVASILSIGISIPLLRRYAMDLPIARSSHAVPTPRGGGLGLVLGVLLGVAAAELAHLPFGQIPVLVLAMLLIGAVGFVDDLGGLSVRARLICQCVVAVIIVTTLEFDSGTWSATAVAAVLLIVGYTNVFNFMDGINGIAGANTLVSMAWFALTGLRQDVPSVVVFATIVGAATLGFLPYNLPVARVFLGDSGSYALGLGTAGLVVVLASEGVPLLGAVAPLAVYVADAGWTLTKRIIGHRPWSEAHREHAYQRLADRVSHTAATAVVALSSALVCVAWLMFADRPVVFVATASMIVVAYLATPQLVSGMRD